jgi:hypothetical protein
VSTTIQRYREQALEDPAVMEHWARSTFGIGAAALERHLRIMNDLQLPGGKISKDDRTWILEQARAAGMDTRRAADVINQVERIADPEQRGRAYVRAAGAPSAEVVETGMNLSKQYSHTWGSERITEKLAESDQARVKDRNQFQFQDTDALKRSREEAGATRRAIEGALQQKGLIAGPATSLEDAQWRADHFARKVADRLEVREVQRARGQQVDLRTELEDAFDTQAALDMKTDAGLPGGSSIAEVVERADGLSSFEDSLRPE